MAVAMALGVAGATLLLTFVPTVSAQTPSPSPSPSETPQEDGEGDAPESRRELARMRTKYSKTFRETDGSYTREISTHQVHYRGGGGWREVEPEVEQCAGPGCAFENREGPFSVQFAPHAASSEVIAVRDAQVNLAYAIEGGAPSPATAEDNRVTYPEIFPSIDLTFTVGSSYVTKELTLRAPPAEPLSFRFPLSMTGLEARKTESGEIVLQNRGGKVAFTIPPSFMTDTPDDDRSAEPAISESVEMTLAQRDGRQVLVLTPDHGWLTDPARNYPVAIDPNITKEPTKDTFIQSNILNTSQATSSTLKSGTYDGGGTKARSLFKFDVSAVRGTVIDTAKLSLFEKHSWSCDNSPVQVHAIDENATWKAGVTWPDRPGIRWPELDKVWAAKGYSSSCPGGRIEFGVKKAVDNWISGTWSNRGFLVRAANESYNNQWKKFASQEATHHPRLLINYNTVPLAPTNLLPADATTSNDVTPTLSGTYRDPDSGDGGFLEFKIVRVDDPNTAADEFEVVANTRWTDAQGSFAEPGETSTWTVPKGVLEEGRLYQWKALSYDHKHHSEWSSLISYTINDTSPSAPGAVTSTTHVPHVPSSSHDVTMRWIAATEPVSDVGGYTWEFTQTKQHDLDNTIETDAGTTPAYRVDRTLDDPTKDREAWFFHIAAVDTNGNKGPQVRYGPLVVDPDGLPVTLSPTIGDLTEAQSDEVGLEQFYPYQSLGMGTSKAYVNLGSGNGVVRQDALRVPGVGLSAVISHTYNSERSRALVHQSNVGRGWTLSVGDVETGLEGLESSAMAAFSEMSDPQNAVTNLDVNAPFLVSDLKSAALQTIGFVLEFTDGDGTTHRFVRRCPESLTEPQCLTTGGRWDSPPGVSLKVREVRDETTSLVEAYRLVRPDGVTYEAREIQGELGLPTTIWAVKTVRDRNGNQLTYGYESTSETASSADQLLGVRLTSIEHNAYRNDPLVASFAYDANGNLDSVTSRPNSASPRTVDYSVDDEGLLRSVTRNAHDDGLDTDRNTTKFGYAGDPLDSANSSPTATSRRVLEDVTDAKENTSTLLYLEDHPDELTARLRVRQIDDRRREPWKFAYAPPGTAGNRKTTFTAPDAADTVYRISPRGPVSDSDERVAGGNVVRITDAGNDKGPVVNRYTWEQNRMITKVDGLGNTTEMYYNDLGLLTKVTEPAPNVDRATRPDDAPVSRIATTLSYSATSDPDHKIPNCTRPASSSERISTGGYCVTVMDMTRSVYASNVTATTTRSDQRRATDFGHDANGNLTSVTAGDAAGNTTRSMSMTYWGAGLLRRIDGLRTDKADVTEFGDRAHVTGTVTDDRYGGYHASGQPRAIEDAAGKIKEIGYTAYGMVATVTDRAGRVTTTSYNDRDLPIEVTDPAGDSTTFTYDANANVLEETSPRGTATTTDEDDFETRYEYNQNDWLVLVSTPGQAETERSEVATTYYADGMKQSTRQAVDATRTAVVDFTYYPNNSLKKTERPLGTGRRGATTHFYDLAGRVVRTDLPAAQAGATAKPKTLTSYTPQGQPAKVEETSAKLDANGDPILRTVRYAYNAHGETIQTLGPRTNGAGVTEEQVQSYSVFGEVKTLKRRLTGTKWLTHSFTYDGAGNKKSATQPAGTGGSLKTTFRYDALNRITFQSDPFNPKHSVTYTYLAEGQQDRRTDWHDPDGASGPDPKVARRTTDRAYNQDYTLRSEVAENAATGQTVATCNWTGDDQASGYDPNGNLLDSRTVKGTSGCTGGNVVRSVSFDYDEKDRVEQSVQTADIPGDAHPAVTRTQTIDWRLDDVMESSTWKEGGPSSAGAERTTRYEHSNGKLLEEITDWRAVAENQSTFEYGPSGALDAASLGTDGTAAPDAALDVTRYLNGAAKRLAWTHGTTTLRSHESITYDVGGMRASELVRVEPPANETMDDVDGKASFGYDLAGRLTTWTSPFDMADLEGESGPPTHEYVLDDAGNITTENVDAAGSQRRSVTATYVHGRLEHRTIESHRSIVPGESGTTTEQDFTYTDLGEEKKRTTTLTTDVDGVEVDSEAQIRCYDASGRTRRVVDVAVGSSGCPEPVAGGKKIEYVYGQGGVVGRTSESTTGTTRRLFFYFGTSQARAEETAPDGTTKIRYLVAPGTGVLAQQKPAATRSWIWLLRDASQNVATHVATDGTVTAQKSYDPYGGKEEGGTKKSSEDPGANTEAQGSHADRETNNLFLGPRIYDPTTDRFTTPDFFVAAGPDLALGTDPLTGNRYLFAAANPVAFFENGYEPCPKDPDRGCDYYYSGSRDSTGGESRATAPGTIAVADSRYPAVGPDVGEFAGPPTPPLVGPPAPPQVASFPPRANSDDPLVFGMWESPWWPFFRTNAKHFVLRGGRPGFHWFNHRYRIEWDARNKWHFNDNVKHHPKAPEAHQPPSNGLWHWLGPLGGEVMLLPPVIPIEVFCSGEIHDPEFCPGEQGFPPA